MRGAGGLATVADYWFTAPRSLVTVKQQMPSPASDISEFARSTAAFRQKLGAGLVTERRAADYIALRNSLLHAPEEARAFYWRTEETARHIDDANVTGMMWNYIRLLFLEWLQEWKNVEKFGDSEIDKIVDGYCQVLWELAARAETHLPSTERNLIKWRLTEPKTQDQEDIDACDEAARQGFALLEEEEARQEH